MALAATASAQDLYRWTDADGKVHYGDHLPKGYKGPFTVIQPDMPATPPAPAMAPAAIAPSVPPPASATAADTTPAKDIATKRRETRQALEARVDKAREKLADAKKARQDGEPLRDEEHQIVQRSGSPADFATVGRSNCTYSKDAKGKPVAMCPALVPSEGYWDRIKGLDDAVKDAEAELDAAKEAYVRGVD
jgi:hypothetical protein